MNTLKCKIQIVNSEGENNLILKDSFFGNNNCSTTAVVADRTKYNVDKWNIDIIVYKINGKYDLGPTFPRKMHIVKSVAFIESK